jgi:hypothetical protein
MKVEKKGSLGKVTNNMQKKFQKMQSVEFADKIQNSLLANFKQKILNS